MSTNAVQWPYQSHLQTGDAIEGEYMAVSTAHDDIVGWTYFK